MRYDRAVFKKMSSGRRREGVREISLWYKYYKGKRERVIVWVTVESKETCQARARNMWREACPSNSRDDILELAVANMNLYNLDRLELVEARVDGGRDKPVSVRRGS